MSECALTEHGRQRVLIITSTHAKTKKIAKILTVISSFFKTLQNTAEQLTSETAIKRILETAQQHITSLTTYDIKTRPLTHGDLGQMQFYVNYYEQEIKGNDDNPTVGLVLCTKKKEAIVKCTLGNQARQIFASKYQFHLPTEEELEAELERELESIETNEK